MKTILTLTLTLLSFSALSDDRCSPYVTETTSVIANMSSCDAAARLARTCATGGRSDSFLATAVIDLCFELKGGEENLSAARKRKLKSGYKNCSAIYGDRHGEALFCMMDVVRLI